MKLTRERKIYAGIFGLAIAALVVDQLVLGGSPDAAEAAENLLVASETTSAQPAGARTRPGEPTGGGPEAITQMLQSLHDRQAQQLELAPNVFTASWIKVPDSVRQRYAHGSNLSGITGHKLTAILAGGRNGAAVMVDGKIVHLGQAIDGFKLVSVDKQSALFEGQGVQVRLTMGGDPQVLRNTRK